jgi:hypothetical protein
MGLRKKLDLSWKGKEYPLLVTMEVVDRVEDHINTSLLSVQLSKGDIRYSKLAKFVALMLNEAGADATQEEVYCEAFSNGSAGVVEIQETVGAMLSAFFPEQKKKESSAKTKPKAVKAA